MTAEQTCAYLSIKRDTLRRLIKEGRVPEPIKLGTGDKGMRFDRAKIDYYIDQGVIG